MNYIETAQQLGLNDPKIAKDLSTMAKNITTNVLNSWEFKRKINIIISAFITSISNGVNFSSEPIAPAWINMSNNAIYINPELVSDMAFEMLIFMYGEPVEYTDEDVKKEIKKFILGLVFHEIGHFLFSPSPETSNKNYTKYCNGIPQGFASLVHNACEDVFIQTQLIREYQNNSLREAILTLQDYHQGRAPKKMMEYMLATTGLQVYNIMYYLFILRGYNPHDKEVQEFFGRKEELNIPEEIYKIIDEAQYRGDKDQRSEYTFKEVVPRLYKIFMEKIKQEIPSDQPGTEPGGPQGQGQQGQGQEGQGQEGQEQGKAGSQGQEGQGQQTQGGGKSQGGSQGKPQKSTPLGEKTKEQIEQEAKEKLEEYSRQLSGQIEGGKDPTFGGPEKQREEMRQKALSAPDAGAAAFSGVGRFHLPTEPIMSTSRSYKELYRRCASEFARLYNLENAPLKNLLSGKFDSKKATKFYTDYDVKLFYKDAEPQKTHDIAITFVCDFSGSMCGSRMDNTIDMVSAMCSAFQDVDIKTKVYTFGSNTYLVKDFDDTIVIQDEGGSTLYDALTAINSMGGTNPTSAYEHLKDTKGVLEYDTKKFLFFLTDGCMDSQETEETVKTTMEALKSEGWGIFSIGIDFSNSELETLKEFTVGETWAYKSGEIVNLLATDIYEKIENLILNAE